MLEIRPMTLADTEAAAVIEKQIFSDPWSAKGFAVSLKMPNYTYLVAVMGTEIVAYCGMLQALDEADITNVAVAKKYRGLGIAERMLRQLIARGDRAGITAYTLEVRVSNRPAISLYEKLGFQSAGIRRGFYDKPKEDAMIMWRR